MCGEVTGYLPQRQRWLVKLDAGPSTAARADQLRPTDKAKPEAASAGARDQCLCSGGDSDGKDQNASSASCVIGEGRAAIPGLDAADSAVVELVAKHGTQNWPAIAAALALQGQQDDETQLQQRWDAIAPGLAEYLKTGPTMPCSHKCGGCPTKATCHLHDELDIEDIVPQRQCTAPSSDGAAVSAHAAPEAAAQ